MAQSTTNLGKIHVFPSEILYNQFKDIIADNDLALLKDDGAYIVAALLEQNGYVKFSNGLILQWGVIRNSSYSTSWVQSITFPIRFKLAYIAIANAYDVDRTGDHKAEFGCHAFNLTTSGLSYCYHGSAGGDCSDTATYIAIGQA